MNWYLAKIVFKIICGNGNHAAQFDEQLRLVNANTKMLALQKAIELGKSEEDMMKVRNLGRKSLEEVINKLNGLGLYLKKEED